MQARNPSLIEYAIQSIRDRFYSRVEKTDGCWLWQGATASGGYGMFMVAGRKYQAHRAAWEMEFNRAIPDGLYALHRCDVPNCVRPDHIWLGTLAENNADRDFKGRGVAGIRSPQSKLTESDVYGIRALCDQGWTYADIGPSFGVSPQNIGLIGRREAWTQLPEVSHA